MDANEQDTGLVSHYRHLMVGWAVVAKRLVKRLVKRDETKY